MKKALFLLLIIGQSVAAQHHSTMRLVVDPNQKTVTVSQELVYRNQTNDTLNEIVLNDWLHGYSSKNTPMAARFSDEFERSFHQSKEKERGETSSIVMLNQDKTTIPWERDTNHPDVIHVTLKDKLFPQQATTLFLTYTVKIPSDTFTHFGYSDDGSLYLKNFFLVPARYENKGFILYDNLNLDDAANALSDYDITIRIPENLTLQTDLAIIPPDAAAPNSYTLSGKNRLDFTLFIDAKSAFTVYKNNDLEVISNLKGNKLNDIQKALITDKVISFVTDNLGQYPLSKITVAEADYERNPFYGLNQLPFFMSPFTGDFLYEIKFLKTYLNNYLHNTLRLDPRKDAWIYDGIQVYVMMKYIDEYHPDSKMMGNVTKLKLFRGYRLVSLDFNGQYGYFYMLMARKNLDQPLNMPKEKLIRFNEKIASKYKAGLSINYLDRYLEHNIVPNSIRQFMALNTERQTSRADFESILNQNAPKDIHWFFNTLIDSREVFDYKFGPVTKTKDSIRFTLKNKTDIQVPIPVYGIKNKTVVFKKWLDNTQKDSVYTLPRQEADKLVLNYNNEAPELNLKNNWHSLRSFRLSNRPIKFNFMKDLEDPNYNQILYVPTLEYNLYDGFLPGFRFHNKTILDKPFIFDVNPTISTKTQNLSGKAMLYVNQYNRDSKLYNIRYVVGGHYLHYAPDAYYTKVSPTVFLNFRPDDYRNNRKSSIIFKEVVVNKEKSAYVTDDTENYEVFNAKYINTKTEVTHHLHFLGDVQYAKDFGKLASEVQYRKLFDNNRQLNLRLFAGTFLFNKTTTDYFNFGLDRPTDYLFESEYIGRSEKKGLFSQQSIVSDGFFKSMLETRSANRWMVTSNASYSLWNWVEAFADVGLMKNKETKTQFVYDSGIRLNLVTDYFELYFPVYSSNGWEIGQPNYGERIRFIVTFRPDTLINLFTRKWF